MRPPADARQIRIDARSLRGILYSVLKEAVAAGIVASNVMTTVRRPKVRKAVTRVWTADEVLTSIASIAVNHPDYAFFATLIFTGWCRGDLLGLRWSAYDILEDGFGVLSVRRTVVPSEDEGSEFSTPKSERGVRDIIITPEVVTTLDRHAAGHHRSRSTDSPARLRSGTRASG